MENDYLESLISAGERGESVWLSDVREGCTGLPLVVSLDNGTRIDRRINIPHWSTERGRSFVLEYLCDNIYNMLSAHGGHCLRLYIPEGEAELSALIDELKSVFVPGKGYGKAASVAARIGKSLGHPGFAIERCPLSDYRAQETTPELASDRLAGQLLRAAERAQSGLYCGIDVGGTDIKLAGFKNGELVHLREYDWDPASSPTAEGIIEPILALIAEFRSRVGDALLDGIGMSFPDVVINDLIVGGETPKTRAMRENKALDYETEFLKLTQLRTRLSEHCSETARVRIINDGFMTAFAAAVELAAGGQGDKLSEGVFAVSLGTELGNGWLKPDGSLPAIPLELYDLQLELGAMPQRRLPPEDIRCVCNENSGLPGVRRYLGQAACYRMAMELKPELLDGFVCGDKLIRMISAPQDMRKPCLERLMTLSEAGDKDCEEIFRRIGRNLARVSIEAEFLLGALPKSYYVFGRFVKHRRCFELISEGFSQLKADVTLNAADERMAFSPLMKKLRDEGGVSVAQFAQAVGAVYLVNMEE